MKPLLSIVIPTKNRQIYAIEAIASVVRADGGERKMEAVVQDCSDTSLLASMIATRFPDTSLINYQHDNKTISMEDNWDKAFSRASGTYVCGIGDDDVILSNILSCLELMKSEKIDCLRQPMATYFWADSGVRSFNDQILTYPKNCLPEIKSINLDEMYERKVRSCGFGYTEDIAGVYHTIIENDILLKHKRKCGRIIGGPSPDAYTAFAFSAYARNLAVYGVPFSIYGICPDSNASRNVYRKWTKELINELGDKRDESTPDCLPDLQTSEISITESLIYALRDTKEDGRLADMDFSYVFGKSAALNLLIASSLYKKFLVVDRLPEKEKRFLIRFCSFFKARLISQLRNFAANTISYFPQKFRTICLEKMSHSNKAYCRTIFEAAIFLESLND
tara:strand:- start:12 stop:1190 length:1179 start_codon:yes stop_codon:yes gene_type:complete